MENKMCFSRAYGMNGIADGTLILPKIDKDTVVTFEYKGVKIIFMLMNIFDVKEGTQYVSGHVITVIPNYRDGILFRLLAQNNTPTDGSDLVYQYHSPLLAEVNSYINGISKFILYNYDRNNHRLDNDFEEIASLCKHHDTLVLPTFGTSNGVSFFQVASRIFYGLISCLNNEDSEVKKLENIIVTTIFDEDQDNSSSRVIKHLINLKTIHEQTNNEPDCIVCCDMKRNIILNCGHRIACSRCLFDIRRTCGLCPLCKQTITVMYPCYTIIDMTYIPCGDDHIKAGKIFVPCGHYNSTCIECETQHLTAGKCPICHENIITSVKLYQ